MTQKGMVMHMLWIGTAAPYAHGGQLHKSNEALATHIESVYAKHPNLAANQDELETVWRYHYHHPIRLDHDASEALARLGIASEAQLKQLSQYIEAYGVLASVYELQAIPGWDLDTIKLLLPFICTDPPWGVRVRQAPCTQTFKLFVNMDKAFRKKRKDDLGDGSKVALRYQLQKPNLYRVALVASKAPYEPWLWDGTHGNMYGPLGYWAGYGMVENMGPCQKLIIGNYEVGLGQGLIVGTSFAMDKSLEVIKVMKSSYRGIKPNASLQRKEGFKGVACHLQQGPYHLLLYGSLQHLDITVHQKQGAEPYVRTLQTRGMAYTSTKALAKKDGVEEKVLGAALVYESPTHPLTVGAQALYSHYSVPLNLNVGLPHDIFFHGKQSVNVGVFGNGLWKNYHFFGALGHAHNNRVAGLGGVMASFGKKVDGALLLYHYPAGFHALYGKAFGQKGGYNRNKQGVYTGMVYRPIRKLELKGYVDVGQYFVAQKSLHHAPAWEPEVMAAAIYQRSRGHTLSVVCKGKSAPKNARGSKAGLPLLKTAHRGKVTFKATYSFSKKQRAYTEVQIIRRQNNLQEACYGGGIKQFFHYKNEDIDCKWWVTLYHTQGYDTATYFYTHNLQGGLSYPPRYGVGVEGGILLRYRISTHLRAGLCVSFNTCTNALADGRQKKGLHISLQLHYT